MYTKHGCKKIHCKRLHKIDGRLKCEDDLIDPIDDDIIERIWSIIKTPFISFPKCCMSFFPVMFSYSIYSSSYLRLFLNRMGCFH